MLTRQSMKTKITSVVLVLKRDDNQCYPNTDSPAHCNVLTNRWFYNDDGDGDDDGDDEEEDNVDNIWYGLFRHFSHDKAFIKKVNIWLKEMPSNLG